MGKVSGYIWKCHIGGTNELDWRSAEHCVVLLADESSVLNGFLEDVVHVLLHYGTRREAEDEVEIKKQESNKSKNVLLVYR